MRLCYAIPISAGLACILCACATGEKVSDRPRSMIALRYEATIPQLADFTCGAASLATVMTFYWKTPISENKLLSALKVRYTDDQIRHINETGLTFDDMILMARSVSFDAEGAKVSLAHLSEIKGPVIVHLDKGDIKHFVVLRQVGDGVYYVSDPIVGQLAMSKTEFTDQYTGDVLAVWKDDASLPKGTILESPRDGIRLNDTLHEPINIPQFNFSPTIGAPS